jgi:hypothetical protein
MEPPPSRADSRLAAARPVDVCGSETSAEERESPVVA